VPWDRRPIAIGWIDPDIVPSAMMLKLATMISKMALQFSSLHAFETCKA
jgi:hypothetical protein